MGSVISLKFVLIIFLLITVGWAVTQYDSSAVDQSSLSPQKRSFIIQKSVKLLDKFWRTGKLYGEYSRHECPELLGSEDITGNPYFQCNPLLLECLFKGGMESGLEVTHSGIKYKLTATKFDNEKFYRPLFPGMNDLIDIEVPSYLVRISLNEDPSHQYDVILDNTCHLIYLPERRYVHGTINYAPHLSTTDDRFWSWDNYGRDIYIDKYQVNFLEIKEWLDSRRKDDKKIIDLPKDPVEWKFPAHSLSVESMKQFCAHSGKQLMRSELYDAALNLPSRSNTPLRARADRTWYPWGTRQKEHFLRKLVDNEDFRHLEKPNCRQVFSKECIDKFSFEELFLGSSTWLGLNQSYGGYMEFLHNAKDPRFNIFPSSFYLPMSSRWHENGVRGSWDGDISYFESFSFPGSLYKELEGTSYLKVGFRCYKEFAGEF